MTTTNAKEILSRCKTVKEWNETREGLKSYISLKEINDIDRSGLIVQVIGPDTFHEWNIN